jgi:hypothetical protein
VRFTYILIMASILSSGEIEDGNVIMILCGELLLRV